VSQVAPLTSTPGLWYTGAYEDDLASSQHPSQVQSIEEV